MDKPTLERRRVLQMLSLASLAAPLTALSGCAGSIPPRQYQRPRSHIVGGNSRGGR
jgi:hypothetical protein